jgi:hypothetical protein
VKEESHASDADVKQEFADFAAKWLRALALCGFVR